MPPRSPNLAPILRAQPDAVARLFTCIETHNGGRGALSKLSTQIAPELERSPDVLSRSMRAWREGRVAPTFSVLGAVFRALSALDAIPPPTPETQALLALLSQKFPPQDPARALLPWAVNTASQAKIHVDALVAAGMDRDEAQAEVRKTLRGCFHKSGILKAMLE